MKKFRVLLLLICVMFPFSFIGCENTNKQTLSTPTNVSVSGGVIFFDYNSNVDYYTITIDNETSFKIDPKHNQNVQIVDNQVRYDANKTLQLGKTYAIKIKASADKKSDSAYTQVINYKHTPTIKMPENVQVNLTTLTWNMVENATHYVVRVVTPNQTVLRDENNAVIENVTSQNIGDAQLAEYSFNTNQFDFSTLLDAAGNYDFYIKSVLSDGNTFVESNYTSKITYKNIVKLSTPISGKIVNINGDLFLTSVIDPKANAITISCNNVTKQVELNGANTSITNENNILTINLNSFFKDLIDANRLDFNALTNFNFKVQANNLSANPNSQFYTSSDYSSTVEYKNTLTLPAPTNLNVEFNSATNTNLATWQYDDQNVTGYRMYIAKAGEVAVYDFASDVTSFEFSDKYLAIFLQAIGSGNKLNSPFVTYPTDIQSNDLSYTLYSADITWPNIPMTFYLVQLDNELLNISTNSYTLDLNTLNDTSYDFIINAITGNSIRKINTHLNLALKLDTPYVSSSQGFGVNRNNRYELQFTGVENAMGYYIYLKSSEDTTPVRIERLFTNTTINLAQYFTNDVDFLDYDVQIEAVADPFGIYENSDLSSVITVSHIQTLQTPTFYVDNGIVSPISSQQIGETTHYWLKFYSVANAYSYEVLINGNRINIPHSLDSVIEYDVTNYLTSANNYTIRLRALPNPNATNIKASEFAVFDYVQYMQLNMVKNIEVNENDNVYTLSFDLINNANYYSVRIVRLNDNSYNEYLQDLGLSNPFVVNQATDVTAYVKQQGIYYFYVTAFPSSQNSYYTQSKESETYGVVNKLETLSIPSNIGYSNEGKNDFWLYWAGDNHADYYTIKLTDPNDFTYQFNTYNGETIKNISEYLTIQGTYNFEVYSMVNATGDNAKEYAPSRSGTSTLIYTYSLPYDFERYSISMYGTNYNFVVNDVDDLKNLLWYHYVFGIDSETYLRIYLKQNNDEDLREQIIRLSREASSEEHFVYSFDADADWLQLLNNNANENTLFRYLCSKILETYTDLNILADFNLIHTSGPIFSLYYVNSLNQSKVKNELISTSTDYGYGYTYLGKNARRSQTSMFAIDSKQDMVVRTTEQLLQAVQFGYRPKFASNSETAKTVYTNAKAVLSAINNNEMSDLQKVTNIFDWLEYAYTLNYSASKKYVAGVLNEADIDEYGLREEFYLEGIFAGLLDSNSSNYDGEFYLGNRIATSASYSKAFTLLCAIEGINSIVVNGTYSYTVGSNTTTLNHYWNKVYISTDVNNPTNKQWYAVDLTHSDNRVYNNSVTSSYGISSHVYFLVSDNTLQSNLKSQENIKLISNNFATSHECSTIYNYYANSSFALTASELENILLDSGVDSTDINDKGLAYSKEFSSSSDTWSNQNPYNAYRRYNQNTGYGSMQAYILNGLAYAEAMRIKSNKQTTMFEFKFKWDDKDINNSVLSLNNDVSPIVQKIADYQVYFNLVTDVNNNLYQVVQDSGSQSTIVVLTLKHI